MSLKSHDFIMNWKPGEIVENKYQILRAFTGGGMGIVYSARHLAWDIDIAIKHPRPELLKSKEQRRAFEDECETWSRIGLHPYLATCFYTMDIRGLPCVVAEFAEGGSLRDWIIERRLYSGEDTAVVARILRAALTTAWGLDRAHDTALIHCDMKPGNVLMADDGVAKVTDFGLAKILSGSSGSAVAAGRTLAYASPEQARQDPITQATDIWSWAVSVMEMFMGGIHWQSGPAAGAALEEFGDRERKTVGLPGMPKPVFSLLSRCLRHRPNDRPDSFAKIAEELQEIYKDQFGEPCDLAKADDELLAADSLNNRAVCLLDVGRDADAEGLLKEALSIDPQNPEATFNLGLLHELRGEVVESWVVENLGLAAQLEPGNSTVHKLLGLFYRRVGKDNEAERCFSAAIKQAWTEAEEAEIARNRSLTTISRSSFALATPRSGFDFQADITRFRRLMRKTELSLADGRIEDATRYVQMAGDVEGFGRHPRLKRALTQLGE